MKKQLTRILAGVLAALMLLSLVPMAYAEELPQEPPAEPVRYSVTVADTLYTDTYEEGASVPIVFTVPEGGTLTGWQSEQLGALAAEASSFTMPAANVVLVPQVSYDEAPADDPVLYKLTVNGEVYGKGMYAEGEEVTFTAPANCKLEGISLTGGANIDDVIAGKFAMPASEVEISCEILPDDAHATPDLSVGGILMYMPCQFDSSHSRGMSYIAGTYTLYRQCNGVPGLHRQHGSLSGCLPEPGRLRHAQAGLGGGRGSPGHRPLAEL